MTQMGSVPKNSDPRRRSQAPGWLKAILPSCWLATFDGVSRRTGPTQTLHTDRSKGTWRIHRDGLTVIALGRGRGGSASLKVPDARASAGGALPRPGQANITDDTFGMGTSCHSARGAPTAREARERPVLTSWNTHLNNRKQRGQTSSSACEPRKGLRRYGARRRPLQASPARQHCAHVTHLSPPRPHTELP